jgi:SAM-dependent methyltransferase
MKRKDRTITAFAGDDWREVTLDIDERVRPDVVDRLPELATIADGSFDAVYSSHNIEHLYPHEIPVAFAAFRRVLKEDGFAIVTCPDLQTVAEALASGDIDTPLYMSSAGPVSALDMLYGFRPALARGNLFMAHHCGFTLKSLAAAFKSAGFARVAGLRRPEARDVWTIATRSALDTAEVDRLAKTYLPFA